MLVGTGDISRELGSDESVLWSGRPGQGVRFRYSDIFLIPFGFFFAAVPAFIVVSTLRRDGASGTALFALPHLLLGLYLLVGRFLVDSFQRAHTYYFVTDQRVLILQLWPRRKLESVDLRYLEVIQRVAHGDGTTTLLLGRPQRPRTPPPTLQRIQDGQRVYELVLEAGDDDDDDDDDESRD
jgi:hypothetical protein